MDTKFCKMSRDMSTPPGPHESSAQNSAEKDGLASFRSYSSHGICLHTTAHYGDVSQLVEVDVAGDKAMATLIGTELDRPLPMVDELVDFAKIVPEAVSQDTFNTFDVSQPFAPPVSTSFSTSANTSSPSSSMTGPRRMPSRSLMMGGNPKPAQDKSKVIHDGHLMDDWKKRIPGILIDSRLSPTPRSFSTSARRQGSCSRTLALTIGSLLTGSPSC